MHGLRASLRARELCMSAAGNHGELEIVLPGLLLGNGLCAYVRSPLEGVSKTDGATDYQILYQGSTYGGSPSLRRPTFYL